MSTDTITREVTATAAERAQRVFAEINDGWDTQRVLIERLGMPKTTLINTLAFLIEAGRITKREGEGRQVYYGTVNAYAPVEDMPQARPDRSLPRGTVTGMDRLLDTPDPRIAALLAARPGAIVPQQAQGGTASAPEIAAAPRAGRLPKGKAEEMILAHLEAHPQDQFGPYELGRAIAPAGHRPLGVRDACARMADDGKIRRVCDSPVRYMYAG